MAFKRLSKLRQVQSELFQKNSEPGLSPRELKRWVTRKVRLLIKIPKRPTQPLNWISILKIKNPAQFKHRYQAGLLISFSNNRLHRYHYCEHVGAHIQFLGDKSLCLSSHSRQIEPSIYDRFPELLAY